MKRAPAGLVFAVAFGLLSPLASAQTPPAAPSADDAAMAAQKAAFMALPEATRKAAQEALVWLGLYVGVNDGDFGKRTRDAILAFQASLKAPADGTLSAPELKALLAAAQKAREAAGFQVVSDPKTGAKIGAPLKLLSARRGARLDFASNADADLGALYARLSAATPARKIAYKAIKPDAFFVVSGQDGPVKFYTRFDKNPNCEPAHPRLHLRLSGVADRHPRPNCDRHRQFIRAVPGIRGGAGGRRGETPPRLPRRVRPPPPAVPQPAATALVVAPGKALTALKADDCPNPTVAGKPVRIERADAATGLTMLAGDFASNGEAPRFGAPAQDLVILGFAGPAPCGKLGLVCRRRSAADRHRCCGQGRERRTGVRSKRGAGRPRRADRRRAQARRRRRPRRPARPDRVRGGSRLPRRRRTHIRGAASLSAGDIAAREKKALVAVFCQK